MMSEMDSIRENDTWELVELPSGRKLLPCNKYIFGSDQPKYKARLVAKGFKQEDGVPYHEIFSPVVKMRIRLLLGSHRDKRP